MKALRPRPNRATRQLIYSLLADYPRYDEYIKQRKLEIAFEHQQKNLDDNFGGGRSNSYTGDPAALAKLEAEEADWRLQALEREYKAITDCYLDGPEEAQIICQECYFKRQSVETIDSLINKGKLLVSKATANRIWSAWLENMAERLGLRMNHI